MKTNFKRLAALVLTLCTLASLMVPVAFAEDAAVEAPAASVSAAETYPIRLVDLTQTDYTAATGYSRWFKGGSGWKDILMSAVAAITSSPNPEEEYANGNLNWRFIGTNDTKYRYNLNVLHQVAFNDKDTWAALQIRVSEDGRYALNLHTDKTDTTITDATGKETWFNISTEWKGNVTAYIIPLADYNAKVAAGAEVNAAIESLMTEANCVGTQALAADETDVTFNKVRMEKGEYVVVYTASAKYYPLCEMTLLEDAADAAMYETKQVVTYPIRFIDPTVDPTKATYPATGFVTGGTAYTNRAYSAITALVDELYEAGDLNWKFLAQDSTAAAQYRVNTAMQLRSNQNGLVALQIDVPQSGYYFLTVGIDRNTDYTYVTNSNAAAEMNVAAYLINKADLTADVTADNIASLAVDANSVGVASLATDVSSAMFERTYMEAGQYVLVYAITNNQVNIAKFGLAQYVIDMPLTAEGATATQHIELNALETGDATLAAASSYADISEYVNASYAAGSMDWKIENYADEFSGANFIFVNGKGLKAATPATSAGDWFALRIRVKNSGNYSINLKSAGVSDQFVAYMFPATSDAMTPEEIAANMTDANGIYYNGYQVGQLDAKISAGYLEGEYILVFQSIHATKSRTVYLDDIILESEEFTAEDVQFYNFNLFDETNAGYYELINNCYNEVTVDGVTTYEKADPANGNFRDLKYFPIGKDKYGALYQAVYRADGLGYPGTLNWRPDAANAVAADTYNVGVDSKWYLIQNSDPDKGYVFKADLSDKKSVNATQYASITLRVDKAGTYDVNIGVGFYTSVAKVYFVNTFTYSAAEGGSVNMTPLATVQSVLENGTGLLTDDYTTLTRLETVNVGRVTVDKAGDYLILFETKDEAINEGVEGATDFTTVDDICLNSIALTPVIEDAGAARISNVSYPSFEAAVAAAKAGDTITLLDNAVASVVELDENVTLNLNGYALNADSVDATAPGAQIIDSGDGIAKLRAASLELNEDNAQLPLYNGVADYYCFYNVDVQAVATTGKSNDTKYWFKVNFSNSEALDLIGADTELRMQVLMEGVYKTGHELEGQAFAATASADAAFSQKWAAKSTSYIVVSTVGSNGLVDFVLNPAVSANGVTISGDDMVRGV